MKKVIASVGLVALFAVHAAAQTTTTTTTAVEVVGTWDVSFTTQNGTQPGQLVLKKDGAKIAGTLSSQAGTAAAEAEVKGKDVTVSFVFPTQNGNVPISMAGTVDGNTIKGSINANGNAVGEWSATRKATAQETKEPAKDAKDLSGAWTINLNLGDINATPSLTIKQEGEKLTGEYVSQQYGKFPVTGSVKGSDVTFNVAMNIEGNAFTAAYAGTIEADGSLKGSVDLGGQMSGTFTATKKK